jgi:hypothetical protein
MFLLLQLDLWKHVGKALCDAKEAVLPQVDEEPLDLEDAVQV